MFSSSSDNKFLLLEGEFLLFSLIADTFGGRGGALFFSISKDGVSNEVEGEGKKCTDVFKSGGNILGQSASKR